MKNKVKSILNKFLKRADVPAAIQDVPSFAGNPNVKVGAGCYIFNCNIEDHTYLSVNVSMMNASIGRFCSIGQGVCIGLGMHPSRDFVSTHPAFFAANKEVTISFAKENHFREMGNTIIGNDVWIGVNAIVMDDVTIGDGAIIGAGAIVTKDVPPYAIVAGSPARVLRYRFEKEQIAFLLQYKWWEKDVNWLRDNYLLFHDVGAFIKHVKTQGNS